MVPPVGEIPPSAASLTRLIFGDKAQSLGKSKSKSSSAVQGSKRKAFEAASSQNVASALASSSTLVAERISIPSEDTIPSQGDASGTNGSGFDGCDMAAGHDAAANQSQDEDVIIIDNDDATPAKKRRKKCTSDVWQYFTKKQEIVEIDGRKYIQVWGHCNFPRCKAKYRAEGHQGTSGFWNHLKSAHSIVKGQMYLKTEKDHVKDITAIEPYKYDQGVSLKKLYLAIIMHEYPFNIVEHEYFVEFIRSLRPHFPINSRITTRKDIMDLYLEEKEKLYAHLRTVKCRFSATMDMWTSCQNKSYMCVTLRWIDDEFRIQKRIIGFFYVEGRHTVQKLSQTFTEVMVKWYIEKKLLALTLDNASANEGPAGEQCKYDL